MWESEKKTKQKLQCMEMIMMSENKTKKGFEREQKITHRRPNKNTVTLKGKWTTIVAFSMAFNMLASRKFSRFSLSLFGRCDSRFISHFREAHEKSFAHVQALSQKFLLHSSTHDTPDSLCSWKSLHSLACVSRGGVPINYRKWTFFV